MARQEIFEKIVNGGDIVFITAPLVAVEDPLRTYSNYYLSPIDIRTKKVSEGREMRYNRESHLDSSYMSSIKSFKFYLYDFRLSSGFQDAEASTEKMQKFIQAAKMPAVNLIDHPEYSVKDNSNHIISATFHIQYFIGRENRQTLWDNTGLAIFLPPPTDNDSIDEMINYILERFGKTASKEPFPPWVSRIDLPGINTLDRRLGILNTDKKVVEQKVQDTQRKKYELEHYFLLLTSTGNSLEEAVHNAFKLLGFDDIRRGRSRGVEDWVFDFTNPAAKFTQAVIEVTGTEERIAKNKIVQCYKWVGDYYDEKGVIAKGVFVPNQYRNQPYPDSIDKRLHFENHEKNFAETKNICILP
jgi:hypothetical protein